MPEVSHLTPATAAPDPLVQFRRWYDEAVAAGVRQPDAMTLATATSDGDVSARTVLLRGPAGDWVTAEGFVFYTNLESAKARAIAQNPRAALVFHWREVERQVRVTGSVGRVSDEQAAAYWETRPRGHRISAWASPQSEVVDAEMLARLVAQAEERFAGTEPPLPPFWGGFVVEPRDFEFWQGRADRLHDRVRYRGGDASGRGGAWVREQLAP